MPAEVLFGININESGDIYFSINNKQWFDKIFKSDSYGVSVDLVSKTKYDCSIEDIDISLPKGKMLFPVYRPDLLKQNIELQNGTIYTKIGKMPASLKNKDVEGNLVILNGNNICYYTNFVDIDRSSWNLLPMGLFTDSLININPGNSTLANSGENFTFTKKIQFEIPFSKSASTFSEDYIKRLYDSLELKKYLIRKLNIRAYSSIEGPEKINKELMSKRALSIVSALNKYQSLNNRVHILTAENWVEFFQDIAGTDYEDLKDWSKTSIKQKLVDTSLSNKLESILSRHRKVVADLYIETVSGAEEVKDSSIEGELRIAASSKNVDRARLLQKELMERIIDKKLPIEYISRVEVPSSKEFSSFLNDREVYKFLLKATTEYEALENFILLKKIDPQNGRINYNICALRFFAWQYGADSLSAKMLLKEINELKNQGISINLVKRMMINYHILKSEDEMNVQNYKSKDSSLNAIRSIYTGMTMSDEEIYSLAKCYSFYSHRDWAKEIVSPRINKIDVSENLVFYFVNLLFFNPSDYDSDLFDQGCLMAINLNRERFCNFFLSNNNGGAGIQLLDDDDLRFRYCENCK